MTMSQSAAIRYAISRKGLGICVSCAAELPDTKAKWPRCRSCQTAHNESPKVKAARAIRLIRYRANRDPSECSSSYCKTQPAKDRKMCRRHLDLQAAAVRRYKKRKDEEDRNET